MPIYIYIMNGIFFFIIYSRERSHQSPAAQRHALYVYAMESVIKYTTYKEAEEYSFSE